MLSPEEERNLYKLLDSLQEEHINIAMEIAKANGYTIDSSSYDVLIRFLGDAYLPRIKNADLREKLQIILNQPNINRYFTKKTVVKIPEKIQLFKKVRHLSLVGAIDSISFPQHNFREMASLKSLKINGSSMCSLPDDLFELRQLEYLNLAANLLEEIPPAISKLDKLQTLILSNNICLKSLPVELFELPNLRILYIDNCPIEELPKAFVDSGITYLRINGYKYKVPEDDFFYCLMDETDFKKAYNCREYTLLNNVPLSVIQHGAFHIKKYLDKE